MQEQHSSIEDWLNSTELRTWYDRYVRPGLRQLNQQQRVALLAEIDRIRKEIDRIRKELAAEAVA